MIRDLDDFCCAAAAASENEYTGGTFQFGGAKLSKPSRKQIKAAADKAYDELWFAGPYATHLSAPRRPSRRRTHTSHFWSAAFPYFISISIADDTSLRRTASQPYGFEKEINKSLKQRTKGKRLYGQVDRLVTGLPKEEQKFANLPRKRGAQMEESCDEQNGRRTGLTKGLVERGVNCPWQSTGY